MSDNLPEILVIREGLLSIQVCTTIQPEKMQDIPLKLGNPGTSCGRWEFPDFDERPELMPIKCQEHHGRWHYVLVC